MHFYLLLSSATLATFIFALVLWRRTKSVSFPVGALLLFFWSLQGGWQLVYDKMGHGEGAQYHYSYFEDKLFPINLDPSYFSALTLYALFVIVTLATVLFIAKRVPTESPPRPVRISHFVLIVVSLLALALSYALVRHGVAGAETSHISVYSETRGSFADSPLFTIHQLLNRIALLGIGLGIVIYMSGREALRIVGNGGKPLLIAYLLIITVAVAFVGILGDRQELLFTAVTSALFYIVNCPRPRLLLLMVAAFVFLSVVGVIGSIRGTPLDKIPDALKAIDLKTVFVSNATSNEQFAAHFSMYGAIKYNVPFTYGSSFIYLATSLIPRFILPERPEGAYEHYVRYVNAAPGQGYTIHHATAWYLNFGVPGLMIGAMIFGWIWATSFNLFYADHTRKGIVRRVAINLLPWSFVGYIPVLIRTGPEGYKAWALESVFLPTLVITIAAVCRNRGRSHTELQTHGIELQPVSRSYSRRSRFAKPASRPAAGYIAASLRWDHQPPIRHSR